MSEGAGPTWSTGLCGCLEIKTDSPVDPWNYTLSVCHELHCALQLVFVQKTIHHALFDVCRFLTRRLTIVGFTGAGRCVLPLLHVCRHSQDSA